ncbi:PPE family protein [Mycobacterium cookii]|uniref:PPE family protein PPE15 n=1 Tax=Mycobacterium cookii TaxID=1775 RepID=A0A7I7KQB0_9MYCO|nr:PPE family protein [Mycobacterium cookii]MCV7328564.1 PPE family protein [Mycobacterium cookii]BBX44350.1 PPE family protein PPE15 [Mycobacterium cookii]
MSFMIFPPELNSALMYSGAGSGPLMAAASAWDMLAADLEAAAGSFQAIVSELTGSSWLGPSSMRMVSATTPYVDWLAGTAGQAAQTGIQARMAAAAYESAFAGTVPPAVIAANRALLAALVATNFLGQNTPAIAATEAHYMEMWFQDGLSMDTYAAASEQAVVLPQQTPAPATSDGGLSSDLAAAAQSIENSITTALNNLSTTLQGLLSGNSTAGTTSTNGLSSALSSAVTNLTGASSTAHSAAATSGASTAATAPAVGSATSSLLPIQGAYYATMFASMPVKMLMSMANSMNASQALQAGQQAMLADVSSLVDAKLKALMGGISGQMRGFGSSLTAQLASAQRLGGLSIPNGWASNAPEMVRAAPVLPANSVAPLNPSAALPNSPYTQALMGAMNGRGMGTQAAKTASVKVETRTPAGG